MITAASFDNLKGLQQIEVNLGRLTLLVGPNAVGKTTLLEGLSLMGMVAERLPRTSTDKSIQDIQQIFRDRWSPKNLVRAGHHEAFFRVEASENLPTPPQTTSQTSYLAVTIQTGAPAAPISSLGWRNPHEIPDQIFFSEDTTHAPTSPGVVQKKFQNAFFLQGWLDDLARTERINLDPAQISRPSIIQLHPPTFQADGAQLAAFLQYLHGLRDGTLERIEEKTREVVPRFRRLRFNPTMIEQEETEILKVNDQALTRKVQRQHPGVELVFEFEKGAIVPAAHVSEGTLLALALFAVTFEPQRRGMLLIDDLDRALHPAAQARVVAALRGALDATPGLQIVATTHSPDLVDACQPDEVRVMGFDAEGTPRIADLNQHPEAPRWIKLLRTGEFWNSVGEDWVAQQPAPPQAERKEATDGHG